MNDIQRVDKMSPGYAYHYESLSSNLLAFTVTNIYGKAVVVQISTAFGPVYHVACQKVL